MSFLSGFDKLLVVFLLVIGVVLFASANVDETQPYHYLQQVAISSVNLGSVDADSDGNIDLANKADSANTAALAEKANMVFCNGDYNTFENCTAPPVAPSTSGVPSGTIVMWSGSVASIPSGWKLCDGTNGTPDLSGKFIVGYSSGNEDYNVIGNTGGANNVTLTTNQIPSHSHTMTGSTESAGSHSHTGSTNSTGSHSHSYSRRSGSTTRTGSSNPQVSTTSLENATTGSSEITLTHCQ